MRRHICQEVEGKAGRRSGGVLGTLHMPPLHPSPHPSQLSDPSVAAALTLSSPWSGGGRHEQHPTHWRTQSLRRQ